MSDTGKVRASRDGDQFHYTWAARQCLQLLAPTSELKAITIEGPSLNEGAAPIDAGEELIDVGQYYGSEQADQASKIRYIQLKHSTKNEHKPWSPSGLEKTIAGFAERYKELIKQNPSIALEFSFFTNRPIHAEFSQAVKETALGQQTSDKTNYNKLKAYTGLDGKELSDFCQLLKLEGEQDDLWEQTQSLVQDLSYYLPDSDMDAPTALIAIITKKALSESANNPSITRTDVLRALKTNGESLFPASCRIKDIDHLIARTQEPELFQQIIQAEGRPVIVHADGGVGKSAFATQIYSKLAANGNGVLYDCFGDGLYRSVSQYRHRPQDALVQIANELSSRGLCYPLIPTPHADASAYMKAFRNRIEQSIAFLRNQDDQALLYLIIDAADNAQMAAEEIGSNRAFVKDLIREQMPADVRLIFLCRTHRRYHLDPPPDTIQLALSPFTHAESAAHLRQYYPNASDQDVSEFHRLSSQNPRVQALAIAQQASLAKMLLQLGPNPTTVDDAIGHLLETAITKLRDDAVGIERSQVDSLCTALAVLRPLIPLSVLSAITEVDIAAIRSFVNDLKRPLRITGDRVCFLDEPTESWFREHFKPANEALVFFVNRLTTIASDHAYAAATLPQLMLEAGMLAELVELALSAQALPDTDPLENRDIELQRLDFAFKASLRAKRYDDAAKLALKAGGENAGDKRQRELLQQNTDMASRLLDSRRLEELVYQRTFSTSWMNGHYVYEAALLSGREDLLGEARSKLRMAYEWIRNWSQLSDEERRDESVQEEDLANLILAVLNIDGADACASALRRWRPRRLSYDIGLILARRLVDQERYSDLDKLAIAAGNNCYLVLAINQALREIHRLPPKQATKRCYNMIASPHVDTGILSHFSNQQDLQAVVYLVESAYQHHITCNTKLAILLTLYLPKSPPTSLSFRHERVNGRSVLLWAYVLRSSLLGQSIELSELASDEIRQDLHSPKGSHFLPQETRRFKESMGAVLPWYQLWGKVFVGIIGEQDYAQALADTKQLTDNAMQHQYGNDLTFTHNEIALVWFNSLLSLENITDTNREDFYQWVMEKTDSLLRPTSRCLARTACRRAELKEYGLEFAQVAYERITASREAAENQISEYLELARAVFAINKDEARAYFDLAIQEASKIGEENLDRWNALITLAAHSKTTQPASSKTPQAPLAKVDQQEVAYRLARCAELTYKYVARDKHFEWEETVKALATLCGFSSLAIASRWRDRDFGEHQRILPTLIQYLLEQQELDSQSALALIGIRAQWNIPQLLSYALAAEQNGNARQRLAEVAFRYFSLEQQSWADWQAFQSILQTFQLSIADFSVYMANNQPKETELSDENNDPYVNLHNTSQKEKDWASIFSDLDLSSAEGLLKAYQRFRNSKPPYHSEQFFNEATQRVNIGKEAAFIAAISDAQCFGFYEIQDFLQHFPRKWSNRLTVKPALATMLKTLCRQKFYRFSLNHYYQSLPLERVYVLSGLTRADLIEQVLIGAAETGETLADNPYFKWAGFLAEKLKTDQVLEVLQLGLDLLEESLEEQDGDGNWSDALQPPADIHSALAGYIWGCLAAPQASLRWEAAHSVRTLAYFNDKAVLPQIVAMDGHTTWSVFVDASLPFYHLHARLWLLIALARSAQESPEQVACYQDYLLQNAFSDEPHVLIQEFAKQALLTLIDTGSLTLTEEDYRKLLQINIPSLSMQNSAKKTPFSQSRRHNSNTRDTDKRFSFGIDIGPYWFKPLARCFGVSQQDIEAEATKIITEDWGVQDNVFGHNDARYRKDIFKGQNTTHSHGSSPQTEDWHFYLCYHAMMVVAGKLLAQIPVRDDEDSENQDNSFSIWLQEQGLYRRDHRWLADRSDPNPLSQAAWQEKQTLEEWRWSLNKDDFEHSLIQPEGYLNLWGIWNQAHNGRKESIHIRSALVSPQNALALLRALQSTRNSQDYLIPSIESGDEYQPDIAGFRLQGWVSDRDNAWGLDDKDPWAGGIRYPAPTPAPYIIEQMQLRSDQEARAWSIDGQNNAVARSHIWGRLPEHNRDEVKDEGYRLQATFPFVIHLLQQLNMDMIVKIEMERTERYDSWKRNNNDDFKYTLPNTKLFLIRTNGRIVTL